MSWYQKILYGVDLDEEQTRQDQADFDLMILNDQALERGHWDRSTYDQAELNRKRSQINDVQGEVDKAFDEGWGDGYNNITGGINATLKAPFNFAWKSIPWQVWALAAVGLFFWMGGASMLKGRLAK